MGKVQGLCVCSDSELHHLASYPQGLSCPIYTERKTGQPTGVVSVAAKAVAVARGYVANEGGGHQVAFQPFLRHQMWPAGAVAHDGT